MKTKFKFYLNSVRPIKRKEAKYYCKYCGFCKRFYDSKKPLFLLSSRDVCITDKNIFTNDDHIFTLEALNEKLKEIINNQN